MKEALSLNGNELVEFTTYFSIGYALGIVPAQIIQTMVGLGSSNSHSTGF